MKLEITNEKVNRLLHRTELECQMDFDGPTPTLKEILGEIASKKKAKEDLIVIDSIKQDYGRTRASCFIKIYESEKAMKKLEGEKKLEKIKKKLEKAKAPEKQEEPPAEQAEETNEEKKEKSPEEGKKEEAKPAEEEKKE